MIRVLLTNIVKDRERFYLLIINKNIFNEYILERTYGNINNNSFTGQIVNIHSSIEEAMIKLKNLLRQKQRKKYKIHFIKHINNINKVIDIGSC